MSSDEQSDHLFPCLFKSVHLDREQRTVSVPKRKLVQEAQNPHTPAYSTWNEIRWGGGDAFGYCAAPCEENSREQKMTVNHRDTLTMGGQLPPLQSPVCAEVLGRLFHTAATCAHLHERSTKWSWPMYHLQNWFRSFQNRCESSSWTFFIKLSKWQRKAMKPSACQLYLYSSKS